MRVQGIPYIQGRNDYDDRDDVKYGIAVHCTANNATARGEATYAQRRTDGISAHFYIDVIEIIQSIDTADRCGHAGSYEGNEHAIALEFTGTNDKSRAWWLASVCWDDTGRALAQVIRHHWPEPGQFQARRASVDEMRRRPTVDAFYGHNDMRLAWGGTTHTDPGPNFPWDRLFEAVNNALGGTMTKTDEYVLNLYTAEFYGGPSCGEKVDDEYRTIKKDANGNPVIGTDGKPVYLNVHGNSNVEQRRQIRGDLKKVLSALASGTPPTPAPANLQFTATVTGTAQVVP